MSGKRHRVDEKQVTWLWSDPEQVLRNEGERGDVVFEAPDASKIVTARPPRLPRVRQRRNRLGARDEPDSMGLPFGTLVEDGRVACWSCRQEISAQEVMNAGPGLLVCPGCGARIPFV